MTSRVALVGVTLSGLVAGTVAFVTNISELHARWTNWRKDRAYLAELRHPYPDLLTEGDIETWSSGQIMLAQFQIDGYLGKLKDAPSWVKWCLNSSVIFPESVHKTQYNDKFLLDESYIDRNNRSVLQRRLDQIDDKKTEDSEFLSINEPFQRLLGRSRKQFLSRYKQSDISRLAPAELYLLRNAIYGSHGYHFDTPKLKKYANRMGWRPLQASYKPDLVSKVERCNAFFLQELHPTTELGALGRGVLIRHPKSPNTPRQIRAALCTCLGQPAMHVDCRDSPTQTNDQEFRDYVDLVVEFVIGTENRIEWTFLAERDVAQADIDLFRLHQDRFFASALDFDAALQSTFRARGLDISASRDDDRAAPYWGVRLVLNRGTIDRIGADPGFMRDVSDKICRATHDALELAGPFIPRIRDAPASTENGLEILQKPIVFDGERIQLTKDYVKKYMGLALAEIEFTPRMIVVHAAGPGNLEAVHRRMKDPRLPSGDEAVPEVNISVHYLIDTDGAIYTLMKDFHIARHVAGLGRFAIGIANIAAGPPSEAQLSAVEHLVRELKKRYDSIEWLIDDREVQSFRDTGFWEEKSTDAAIDLGDPGAAVMTKLRNRLTDLGLKGAP